MTNKSKFQLSDVKHAARGKWDTIFTGFNIAVPKLKSHGKCPNCGGTDRFKFDDHFGNGDWICNQCSESKSQDGFELIKRCCPNLSFPDIINEVASIVGLSDISQITDKQRKQWDQERAIRMRVQQEMEEKKQKQVSLQAQGLYRNPYPGESSPYLERKKVPALSGVKIDHKGNVLIPAYDGDRYMWNMQTIYADGAKYFVSDKQDPTGDKRGGRTGGCFFLIGTIELDNPIICIAEGYATGASIHLATGHPVVLSFVANNLHKVGQAIREKNPNAKLVYCADDDSAKQDTGRICAENAVAVTGGIVVLPQFNQNPVSADAQHQGQPPAEVYTDFNDLHLLRGLDEVKRQIDHAISSFADHSPEPPNTANSHFDVSNADNSQLATGQENFLVDAEGSGGGISSGNTKSDDVQDDLTDEDKRLQKWLARFCLVEGETNVWDSYGKKIWKKTAFTTMLGSKKLFDSWNGDAHRKTISRDDVDGLLEEGNHKKAKEMNDRFIMLEGKKATWDTFRREMIGNDVLKENWAGAWDLWAKSKDRRMIWHEDLVFDPSMQIREGQINTYDGMEITPVLDENNQIISNADAIEYCMPILELLEFLCDREPEAHKWLLKWLAYPLQNPGAKMNTSVLLCSTVQGSGKSMFFEKIMTRIYGDKYSVTLGQNGLESIYTDWAERKMYCLFEEVFNNKSKYGMMGLIKHMITGEKIRIEKKFMSGYSQNNHINCVFLSNEVQPLAIEERDRRFCVFEPSKKISDDLRKRVGMCLDSESNAIQAFYTYLLNLDLTDFNQHTEPPMTKAKQKIIQFGLPSWKLFLDDWRGGYLNYPFVCCLSDDLYGAYREWCHKNGEKIIASNKFLNLIASEKCVVKGHGRIYEACLSGSYMQGGKEVQRRIIFTANQPANAKQSDWLSSQVKQFRDKVVEDKNDVPAVI